MRTERFGALPFLIGMERWRLDTEMARDTEMVREMYMKIVGDGDS
jgi:hypothetical protein